MTGGYELPERYDWAELEKVGNTPDELVDMALREEPEHISLARQGIGGLRAFVEDRERTLVLRSRAAGESWAAIAFDLGRSKQSVWEKYHFVDPRDTPDN